MKKVKDSEEEVWPVERNNVVESTEVNISEELTGVSDSGESNQENRSEEQVEMLLSNL